MNKKHVGGGITVEPLSRGFRFGAPRIGTVAFSEVRLTKSGHVGTGKLSYTDGGLVSFVAPLMPGEQDEFNRILESVAKRVEVNLADEVERVRSRRRQKTT